MALCVLTAEADSSPKSHNNIKTVNHAFLPGEKLTFSISWSNVVQAGIAVMEVRAGTTSDGKPAYELLSRTHTVGPVDVFYQCVIPFTASSMPKNSTVAPSRYGKNTAGKASAGHGVRSGERNGKVSYQRLGAKPTPCRNACRTRSLLYYVRTRQILSSEALVVDVHDSGKNWAVEVHTIGKERITTPAGDFDTIVVKTHPSTRACSCTRRDHHLALRTTRKILVLMKSKISIGSIVARLTEIQGGNNRP
jgi:hypothetical protein